MTNKKAAPLRRCLVFIATANRRDKWRDQLRGAGIEVVWKPFLWLAVIGGVLFALSLARFRKTISQMA